MLTFFTAYIRNILQLHFIHLRVQIILLSRDSTISCVHVSPLATIVQLQYLKSLDIVQYTSHPRLALSVRRNCDTLLMRRTQKGMAMQLCSSANFWSRFARHSSNSRMNLETGITDSSFG